MSDDEAASTMSDTASVVGQPRVFRAHPESVDREEGDSGESERGISEPDAEVEEMVEPLSAGAPVELDFRPNHFRPIPF